MTIMRGRYLGRDMSSPRRGQVFVLDVQSPLLFLFGSNQETIIYVPL